MQHNHLLHAHIALVTLHLEQIGISSWRTTPHQNSRPCPSTRKPQALTHCSTYRVVLESVKLSFHCHPNYFKIDIRSITWPFSFSFLGKTRQISSIPHNTSIWESHLFSPHTSSFLILCFLKWVSSHFASTTSQSSQKMKQSDSNAVSHTKQARR